MTMLPNGSADPLAYPRVRLLLRFYVRVPMTMGKTELFGWMQVGEGRRLPRGLTDR